MDTDKVAQYFFDLRQNQRRVDAIPEQYLPASIADGYAVQRVLVDRLCEAGGTRRTGYKIALTNPAAQAIVGADHPVFGCLLANRVYDTGIALPTGDFSARVVEVEFGFTIAKDVSAVTGGHTRETVADFVATMHPCIEIVDHRCRNLKSVPLGALMADNAVHGCLIKGPAAQHWRETNLDEHPVSLLVNGEARLAGAGDRVLGHPLAALAWLANALHEHGLPLRAGDLVTTGLATDGIYEAVAGDQVAGDFGVLGRVELQFV